MPKIVRFHEVGNASVLKLEELSKPQPGEGEVLLKVEAIGLNRAEVIEYGALDPRPTPYPLFVAIRKGIVIRAYTLFQITTDPERSPRARKFVTEGLSAGVLKPVIAKTFKLDEIAEAHRYMESNEQIGKIVVTV
jgi:NADPH:quinone reductase